MNERTDFSNVVAKLDDSLEARIVRRVPLIYLHGADAATDRPQHVRAGSGLALTGNRLAVIQDDANFLALVDPQSGLADAITLPVGHGGLRQFDDSRGNKRYKSDFEALVEVVHENSTRLVAFGSGSTVRRENVLVVADADSSQPRINLVHVPKLYAALRSMVQFSGSELNIEGAVSIDGTIRLFNRGNGAAVGEVLPVNAVCAFDFRAFMAHLDAPDIVESPAITCDAQYELGEIDGTRLSFTDAVVTGQRMLYSAAAEDSPDAVRDGIVAGSAIGLIETLGTATSARWTPLCNEDGTLARVKVEGVAIGKSPEQLFVVVDRDEHDRPSELFELRLSGFKLQ